ncbi:MAG: hypothetical protein IKI31_00690, partial [Treponema sp.]|nr:hypothetical protein [Treponema sp.]
VCADNQMKIEKASSSESTFTKCYEVKNEERVKEISRMLSGETSEASLEHARMLLQKSYKKC